jgi:membrane protein implicated in regulation of membrane protease activity
MHIKLLFATALTAWLVWAGATLESQLSASTPLGSGALSVVELLILALLSASFAARWARGHARRVLSEPLPQRRRRLSRPG